MPITSAAFDAVELKKRADIHRLIFEDWPSQDVDIALRQVTGYRRNIEYRLRNLDSHMTKLLISSNISLLTLWSAWIQSCWHMMDTIDKNLAFKGKRQWNWDEVINAMSFLEATKHLAHIALLNEGIDC